MKFFNFKKKNKKHQTKEDNFNSLESKKINFSWLHDITESDCSIVVSSHKTILCVSQDGNIYHDDPNKNINPLLIYQVTDGVWFLRKNNLSEWDALITDGIKENFKFSSKEKPILVNIGGSLEDGISFNLSGFNLTAELEGKVKFNTTNLLSWENFALLSWDTFSWLQEAKNETWIEQNTGKEVFLKTSIKLIQKHL